MAQLGKYFRIKSIIAILENGEVLHLTPSQVERIKELEIGEI